MKPLFILFAFLFYNEPKDLIDMRNLFPEIGKNQVAANNLINLSQTSKSTPQNIKLAYYSAAYMASAKYKINPYTKYKTFISGKNMLESAIKKDTTNIEPRFIRFIIQNHAPGFLGYNNNLENDKAFIFKNIAQVKKNDIDLFSRIYAFLATTNKISDVEKLSLNFKNN